MDLNFKIFESNEEPDKKPIQTKKPICSCCDCHIANKTISVMVLNDVNLFIVNILCFKASLLVAARVLLEYFLTELAFFGWKVPTEVQEMQAHKKISQLNGIFQQSKDVGRLLLVFQNSFPIKMQPCVPVKECNFVYISYKSNSLQKHSSVSAKKLQNANF